MLGFVGCAAITTIASLRPQPALTITASRPNNARANRNADIRRTSAVIRELQIEAEIFLPQQRNHLLQLVLALALHTELIALDLRLRLQLRVTDLLRDRLRLVIRD